MKKISVIFISILLLALSACSKNEKGSNKNDPKTNELLDIYQNASVSETVKIVTEKESYSQNHSVIRYSITNESDEETAVAGDDNCFVLQMLKDGEWKRVGTKIDHYWNELALILPPHQTENREIKLDDYFHLPLEKGEYRIAVENLISNTFEIS